MIGIPERAVSPGDEFYRTYSAAQVAEVVDSLVRRAEFPYQLTYVGGGSELWRDGEERAGDGGGPARDFDTILHRYAERLLELVPPPRPVRVVDLGPGTGRPIVGLLRHLGDQSRLAGYAGIDMSVELLELAGRNLRAGLPEQAGSLELCHGDFSGPELARVLSPVDSEGRDGPVRFVVLAGGTLYNFDEPERLLRHVAAAMTGDDVLLATVRVDTGVDRPPFMDQVSVGGPYKPQQLAGLDLLGVDRAWYVIETGFDPGRSEIFVRARFAEPVTVAFGSPHGAVSFAPGDTVLLWRYRYLDRPAVTSQLDRSGFEVRLFASGEAAEAVLVAAMLKK